MDTAHSGQLRYEPVALPKGPLEAVEVSEADLLISEETLIFDPKKPVKEEPVYEPPSPPSQRNVTKKRRIFDSSSEEDAAQPKSSFIPEPTDEECFTPGDGFVPISVQAEVHSSGIPFKREASSTLPGEEIIIEDD